MTPHGAKSFASLSMRMFLVCGWALVMTIMTSRCEGLYLPRPSLSHNVGRNAGHRNPTALFVSGFGISSHQEDQKNAEMDEMRRDIASMKEEALKRLQVLNKKMAEYEASAVDIKLQKEQEDEMKRVTSRMQRSLQSELLQKRQQRKKDDISLSALKNLESEFNLNAMERRMESDRHRMEQLKKDAAESSSSSEFHSVSTTASTQATKSSPASSSTSRSPPASLTLLDDTRWRIMYNLGREQGTWMAKTWGASGERLHMHLEVGCVLVTTCWQTLSSRLTACISSYRLSSRKTR